MASNKSIWDQLYKKRIKNIIAPTFYPQYSEEVLPAESIPTADLIQAVHSGEITDLEAQEAYKRMGTIPSYGRIPFSDPAADKMFDAQSYKYRLEDLKNELKKRN